MGFRVGRVHKLAWDKAVRDPGRKLFGLCNGALHAPGAFCEHKLRAVGLHQLSALHRHGFRHNNDDAVTSCRGHGCKANPGIAACRLDDHRVGRKLSLSLRLIYHLPGHTVLHRTGRIKIFQLGYYLCLQPQDFLYMGQLQERSFADQLIG